MSQDSGLEGNVKLLNQPGAAGLGYSSYSGQPEPIQNPIVMDPKNLNTLDEPVIETLKRDLHMIWFKLKYVLNPRIKEEGAKELRNWDLWGPLLLCLMLAFTLSVDAPGGEGSELIFGTIFVIIWAGAGILTVNALLLGGKISFFQSVCVLGYCVFPINLAAVALSVIGIWIKSWELGVIICGLALFWSTTSSVGFMKALVPEEKKLLATYPVILFYFSLSWFVVSTCTIAV